MITDPEVTHIGIPSSNERVPGAMAWYISTNDKVNKFDWDKQVQLALFAYR